jgi:branched-chain amino acid transport system permease protein
MLGGYVMGIAEVMVVGYVSSTFRDAIAFGILIIILIFKPTGLLGSPAAEKV